MLDRRQTADRLKAELAGQRSRRLLRRSIMPRARPAAGLALRPTELFVFGNAKGGTPLMQATQSDRDRSAAQARWSGRTKLACSWFSYNEPAWLADRHGVAEATHQVTANMAALLGAIRETP